MIQDIGVEQLKNEYHPKPPKDESRIMIFDAGKLLCRINEEMQIAYPKYGEWRKIRQMRERSSTFFPLERTLIICCIRRKRQKSRGMSMKRCSVYVEHFLSVSDLQESVLIICIHGMKTIIFAENAEQNS